MDPPLPDQLTAAIPLAAAAAAANLTPAQASAHNRPPYAEMITAAISALNERDGSSKRAIAKYIESQYSVLPHNELLTYHLKRLKTNGQLLMVKHSYKLPKSAPAPVNAAVNAVPSDPASSGPKRRPGRPPKPKPDSVKVAVPVFEPPMNINAVPVSALVAEPMQPNVSIEPVNGPAAAGGQPGRGRGRLPKSGGLKRGPSRPPASGEVKRGPGHPPTIGEVKRGPGRPPASGEVKQGPGSPLESGSSGGPVRRGRGRPKAAADPAPVPVPEAQVKKGPGRPRGRPPKRINVVEGLVPPSVPVAPGAVGGVAPVAGKRRGRPPRADGDAKRPRNVNAGQPKKPRQLSGLPKKMLRKKRFTPKKNSRASFPSSDMVNWLDHDKDFLTLLVLVRDGEEVGMVCNYDIDFWTQLSHKLSETRSCSLTLQMCLDRANELRTIYHNYQTQVQLYKHPNMRQSEFESLLIRVFGHGKPIKIPRLKKNCTCMGTSSGSYSVFEAPSKFQAQANDGASSPSPSQNLHNRLVTVLNDLHSLHGLTCGNLVKVARLFQLPSNSMLADIFLMKVTPSQKLKFIDDLISSGI